MTEVDVQQDLIDALDDIVELEKQLQQIQEERDTLNEKLEEIIQWSNAYPISVFPEPDLKKAHELLKTGGMTLDVISASSMRHVLKGIIEIIEREE